MNHDPNIESAVLGAVLHSAGRLLDTLGLAPEDFHVPAHEQLWIAMRHLFDTGRPVEPAAIMATADRPQFLGSALAECVTAACAPASAGFYAAQLRDHTARRRIAEASARLQQLADSPAERDLDDLSELARGIVDEATRSREVRRATDFAEALAASIERWAEPDTRVQPTGWLDLDEILTGGLRPGHLCIVGARPGVGKSMIATELARSVAATNVGVLFSSLEMSAGEVTDRIAASATSTSLAALTSGQVDDEQMDRLSRWLRVASSWPLEIDDRSGVGVSAIRGRARDLTRRPTGLGLVIVDYLQFVAPTDRRAPREQQVASISRGLKLLARDLEVPVVALAQVNRVSAQRDSKRPAMSDLRESGAIEADADEIWLLHRDEQTTGEIEVNVVKNRHGQTGMVRLGWYPFTGRISNLRRVNGGVA